MTVRLLSVVAMGLLLASCQEEQKKHAFSPVFVEEQVERDTLEFYDLVEIQESGTLIAGTLNGPDTYFEYHGQWIGLQYEMAQEFAQSLGVRLQMETAQDTTALLDKLEKGEIDFIALEMPRWETREDEPLLREAIRKWWKPKRKERMLRAMQENNRPAKRNRRPVMKDLAHGIISQYDDLFIHYSSKIGWDWRLMAAQCYQESGFDPTAVSWMGARGLMQIMPSTATHLGVSKEQLFDPEASISAASRYLKEIYSKFSDVADPQERLCFTLAAYNGGSHHVRDAMALAEKYGARPHVWSDVAMFILRLSDPAYYKDPIVQHGYMRGSETEGYVNSIMARWHEYRSYARPSNGSSVPAPAKRSLEGGEYRSKVKSADEWIPDSL